MSGYLDRQGNYYQGDRQGEDAAVPDRPSSQCVWNGVAWVPDIVAIRASTLTLVREAREVVLNRLAGIGFAAMAAGDTATVQRVLDARTALLGITTATPVATAPDEATLRAALVMVYVGIKTAAGPALDKAFQDFRL